MARNKLVYSIYDVSEATRKFFEDACLMKEDYRSFWMDKISLADVSVENDVPGITFPEGGYEHESEVVVGEEFWKASGIPEDMRQEITAFWDKTPTGEIEWEA